MKKIAVIISSVPHGSARGREGLEATLALSVYNQVSLILIGDGTLHLLNDQQPNTILMRDYIKTFKLLKLYEINAYFACKEDVVERHIVVTNIPVILLDRQEIAALLPTQNVIIHF